MSADLSESERRKYERVWTLQEYRKVSPGANIAVEALGAMGWTAPGHVVDLGCGTGRASQVFAGVGFQVMAIDTALNAMNQDASRNELIDFKQLCLFTDDLSKALPHRPHGFCCDVMEHIPKQFVEAVVANISLACEDVFFGIAHFPDCGWRGNEDLHLTVENPVWWKIILKAHFSSVIQLNANSGRDFKTSYWICRNG